MTAAWQPGSGDEAMSVTVTAPEGLHARPAIKLSRLAKRFRSRLAVRVNGYGDWVDAKSVARVMALKVEEGTRLDFAARGEDSAEALDQLKALVRRDFADVGTDG